jgi:rhodanese-related sulfurtransferase
MGVSTAAEMVATARSLVEALSAEQVAGELVDEKVLLVDLREPDERVSSGAIPGAIHAPRGMLEFHADPTSPYHKPEFDPDGRVILYCASGGRSSLAAATLQILGYSRVAHLGGGMQAWIAAGNPVESV